MSQSLANKMYGYMYGELKDTDFKKYDHGKLEYDLIPDEIIQGVIKVMMYGAYVKGYGKDNWKKCTDQSRYYNALRRHIEAWRSGEVIDEESGLPHLDHALCNLMFMTYLNNKE